MTALMLASMNGYTGMVTMLVEAGADVNQYSSNHVSAFATLFSKPLTNWSLSVIVWVDGAHMGIFQRPLYYCGRTSAIGS